MQVNALAQRLASLSSDLVRRLRLLERNETACCGVPLSQCMVLQTLLGNGDALRMSDVASALGVAQSTATRLVEPLVRQGLVQRRAVADDRRAVAVALTPAGRSTAEELSDIYERWGVEVLERIPVAERETAVRALETVVRAVQQCCDSGCPTVGVLAGRGRNG